MWFARNTDFSILLWGLVRASYTEQLIESLHILILTLRKPEAWYFLYGMRVDYWNPCVIAVSGQQNLLFQFYCYEPTNWFCILFVIKSIFKESSQNISQFYSDFFWNKTDQQWIFFFGEVFFFYSFCINVVL